MSLKNDRYPYRVTWSEDDNEYVGFCAEFPILSWLAKTPETALKGIREVIADIVADMQTAGETIPEPIAGRHYRGKFIVRIPQISDFFSLISSHNILIFTLKYFRQNKICVINWLVGSI